MNVENPPLPRRTTRRPYYLRPGNHLYSPLYLPSRNPRHCPGRHPDNLDRDSRRGVGRHPHNRRTTDRQEHPHRTTHTSTCLRPHRNSPTRKRAEENLGLGSPSVVDRTGLDRTVLTTQGTRRRVRSPTPPTRVRTEDVRRRIETSPRW